MNGPICRPNSAVKLRGGMACGMIPCPAGQECKMTEFFCNSPPCDVVPYCVNMTRSCMTIGCGPDRNCVEIPAFGPVCRLNVDNSTADPCAAITCAMGTVCKAQEVVCIRSPCPPIATCITSSATNMTNPCMTIKCAAGFECRRGDKGDTCYPILTATSPGSPITANHPNVTSVTALPLTTSSHSSALSGVSCMNTRCLAGTICIDSMAGPVCKPSANVTVTGSCSTTPCAVGKQCKMALITMKNVTSPMQTVSPICIDILRSCSTMMCAPATSCMDIPQIGPACVPDNAVLACSTTNCAIGTSCARLLVTCKSAPCPSLPVCVDSPPLPTNPCAAMTCAPNMICQPKNVVCIMAPCLPIGECVAVSLTNGTGPSTMLPPTAATALPSATANPPIATAGPSCMNTRCSSDTVCIDGMSGPTCRSLTNVTVHGNCSNFTCTAGQRCRMTMFLRDPPPTPRMDAAPSCMDLARNCSSTNCVQNSTCVDMAQFGPICLPNNVSLYPTCASVNCSIGTTCVMQQVACLRSPCPPLPSCIFPPPTGNPCAAMLCAPGTTCQLKNVQCLLAPCPPVAECVPVTITNSTGPSCMTIKCAAGFECRKGDRGETCYPIKEDDGCFNHTCPIGQSCQVPTVNCLLPPCPTPRPTCVPTLTCATVKCRANTTCAITKTGPQCLPDDASHEDPCNLVDCPPGQQCIVHGGEGICMRRGHGGASCAATSCPVNSICVEGMNGAQCLMPGAAGSCANVTCGGGSHCAATADGPKCIVGGKRGNRVVDSFGCGGGEQFVRCMPQCQSTCRGINWCDPSIPTPIMHDSNGTIGGENGTSSHWIDSHNATTGPVQTNCVSGCICRAKHRRNVQGNCVANNRCWLTPGCRENEVWSSCMGCAKTCSTPAGPQICTAVCQSGCACEEGFVRTKRGMCVLPEDCAAIDLINGDHGNSTMGPHG